MMTESTLLTNPFAMAMKRRTGHNENQPPPSNQSELLTSRHTSFRQRPYTTIFTKDRGAATTTTVVKGDGLSSTKTIDLLNRSGETAHNRIAKRNIYNMSQHMMSPMKTEIYATEEEAIWYINLVM